MWLWPLSAVTGFALIALGVFGFTVVMERTHGQRYRTGKGLNRNGTHEDLLPNFITVTSHVTRGTLLILVPRSLKMYPHHGTWTLNYKPPGYGQYMRAPKCYAPAKYPLRALGYNMAASSRPQVYSKPKDVALPMQPRGWMKHRYR